MPSELVIENLRLGLVGRSWGILTRSIFCTF